MGEKRRSVLGRTRKTSGDADAPVEAAPRSRSRPGEPREPGGMEATAAAVALAIDRRRRGSRSPAPALEIAETAGPDAWATSGRLAQVNRAPARDPWNR